MMTEKYDQSSDPLANLLGEGEGQQKPTTAQGNGSPPPEQRQSFRRTGSQQPVSRRQVRQSQERVVTGGQSQVAPPQERPQQPLQAEPRQERPIAPPPIDDGHQTESIEQGMKGTAHIDAPVEDLVQVDYNAPDNPLSDVYPAQEGLRGWLYKTFKWDIGASREEIEARREERLRLDREFMNKQQDLDYFQRINRQKDRTKGYCGYITVMSEKGGVGKTTISALVSYILSLVRQDPIVVADLNPDRGSLTKRMGIQPRYSIRDLVNNADKIPYERHVHEFLSKVPGSNVSVLSGDMRPDRRESTSAEDVITVAKVFSSFFSIAVLDNGTGITHSALAGSHQVAHAMALVIDNTDDAYDFVKSTLAYLENRGMKQLRNRVVLVIVDKVQDPGKQTDSSIIEGARQSSHSQDIMEYFVPYVRDTVVIPFDPVLAKSGPIVFDHLQEDTIRATKRLAASLMDDLVA